MIELLGRRIQLCTCYPRVRFRVRFKVHFVIVPTCAINSVAFVSRIFPSPSLSLFSLSPCFSFPISFPFLGFIVTGRVPRPKPSTRNIVGGARTTLVRDASFPPDNFEERPLANKSCDNLYKWRRKIVGFSLALPCRNHQRQQDYGFFSIFDEYRGNEWDRKFSSTARPSRFVLAVTLPDEARHFRRVERTQVSMEMRAIETCWHASISGNVVIRHHPITMNWLKFVLVIYNAI